MPSMQSDFKNVYTSKYAFCMDIRASAATMMRQNQGAGHGRASSSYHLDIFTLLHGFQMSIIEAPNCLLCENDFENENVLRVSSIDATRNLNLPTIKGQRDLSTGWLA